MAVEIQINGTALNPQPREANWESITQGGKVNGTDALGAYSVLVLRSPPARGGTANFNWTSFENSSLTSIQAFPKGQSMKTGTATTYSAGVVTSPIAVRMQPGDIIQSELTVRIVV